MLILGSKLIGTPIMGLQTGTQLAVTKSPIIDPSNLKILAYEVDGPLLSEKPAFIRIADVRELSNMGMIVDSNDEFVKIDDIIALKKIYDLKFKLNGLNVIDQNKHKLGKVSDYNIDTDSFVIQQLHVKRGVIKSLSETESLVHRSQIIEISDYAITVRTAIEKLAPITKSTQLTYMNPFRSSTPQAHNRG